MASDQARSLDFKTPLARLSFADQLFKARVNQNDTSGKKKFGCTLIFPKADLSAKNIKYGDKGMVSLEDIVGMLIVEKWGEKGLERARNGMIKSPFLAGDGKEAKSKKTGELHGGMGPDVFFIRTQANEDRAPGVFAKPSESEIQATPSQVYSGCYGKAVLNAFTWTHPQNGDGVSFGVQFFWKFKDGDKLGGGGTSADEWTEDEAPGNSGSAPSETRTGGGAGSLFGA